MRTNKHLSPNMKLHLTHLIQTLKKKKKAKTPQPSTYLGTEAPFTWKMHGYQTNNSQVTSHKQSAGHSREVWWVSAVLCLMRKLKGVKAFSEKRKKLHNCRLSHSWGTWTYLYVIFPWNTSVGLYSQSRGLLECLRTMIQCKTMEIEKSF